jgi:hypothetical protein
VWCGWGGAAGGGGGGSAVEEGSWGGRTRGKG